MRSTFVRQMTLITVLILLTLSVLGAVFQMGMMRHLANEKRQTLSGNAAAVASLTRAYGSVGDLAASWDFRMSVSLASRVSGGDAVICDETGSVLVCACDAFACKHRTATVSQEFVRDVLSAGELFSVGQMPGLYDEDRYMQALKLESQSGEPLGIIIVSSPAADITEYMRGTFRIFFYTAAIVWLIALLGTAIVTRHEAKPVRELTKTVSRFGHGDLTVRADENMGTTELDKLAAAFNAMADSLEQADKMRSEFVANVSHELKTPMTSIAGYLDGMLDGTIPEERHEHYMHIVSDEVRRLSRLVRSMLEISRMQADGLDESKLSRFDVGEAVGQTLVTFEQKITARRLAVEAELPSKPLYTVAHRDAVVQVIYNLVDNAVKFSSDCGVLTVSVQQNGGKIRVAVKNTGPVIPASELPFIFDRFHKLDKSRSKDPGSVGLGLYIVKTIIGAHGEEIWVESHDGTTAFTFTLPVAK